jgi:hypothetical protein
MSPSDTVLSDKTLTVRMTNIGLMEKINRCIDFVFLFLEIIHGSARLSYRDVTSGDLHSCDE